MDGDTSNYYPSYIRNIFSFIEKYTNFIKTEANVSSMIKDIANFVGIQSSTPVEVSILYFEEKDPYNFKAFNFELSYRDPD